MSPTKWMPPALDESVEAEVHSGYCAQNRNGNSSSMGFRLLVSETDSSQFDWNGVDLGFTKNAHHSNENIR